MESCQPGGGATDDTPILRSSSTFTNRAGGSSVAIFLGVGLSTSDFRFWVFELRFLMSGARREGISVRFVGDVPIASLLSIFIWRVQGVATPGKNATREYSCKKHRSPIADR